MITIIKEPNHLKRKEFTCLRCGCIFQADEWDYEFWNPNGDWAYRIECPVCKDKPWRHYDIHTQQYERVKDVS